MSIASLLGALGGGWLADRLGSRDVRWYAWMPVIGCTVGGQLYWAAYSAGDLTSFISIEFIAELILSMGLPASYAAIQVSCGGQRRVMAMAVLQFFVMVFGGGFGPLIVGALSDVLNVVYEGASLRYSLTAMLLLLVPAAVCFALCAHALPHDLED